MPATDAAGIGRGETGGRAYGESLLHSYYLQNREKYSFKIIFYSIFYSKPAGDVLEYSCSF
jgi:hypothetical protein